MRWTVYRAEEENGDAWRATGYSCDRMIENVYFTYFAVVGMVSLWLPILFFTRGR